MTKSSLYGILVTTKGFLNGVVRPYTLVRCILAFLALSFSATDAQAQNRICLSNFLITDAAPILIPCGGTRMINCSVAYTRDNVGMSWGNCWVVGPAAKNLTAELYDDDGFWGYELYGQTIITVPAAPAAGTIVYTISVTCTFDPNCKKCYVNGDEHEAELLTACWKELNGLGSSVKKARCTCDACPQGMGMQLNDLYGTRGALAMTGLAIESAILAVSQYNVTINFDPQSYTASALHFSDPIVQANTVVTPFPGGVNFSGFFDPPHDFAAGPFATLSLNIDPAAPLAETEISFVDSLSTFIDSSGMVTPVCLVDGKAGSLPMDATAPLINDLRVDFTECSITGHPGSISDIYLDSIPDYVTVEAYYDTNYMGLVHVLPDGSFEFPNIRLPAGSMVQLIATDRADNSSSALIGPAGPCDEIPTLTEWGLIIFGVVLLGFITWVFLKRRKVVAVKA